MLPELLCTFASQELCASKSGHVGVSYQLMTLLESALLQVRIPYYFRDARDAEEMARWLSGE
jgi:hypothetical protein